MKENFPDFDFSKPYGWLDGEPYYLNEQEVIELEARKERYLKEEAKESIQALESLQTPRRIREAILELYGLLGKDAEFLADIESRIVTKRNGINL
jgi:hypothetical protein